VPATVGAGTQTHTSALHQCGVHVFGGARAHRQAHTLVQRRCGMRNPYENAAARQFYFFRKRAWAALCSGVGICIYEWIFFSVWSGESEQSQKSQIQGASVSVLSIKLLPQKTEFKFLHRKKCRALYIFLIV